MISKTLRALTALLLISACRTATAPPPPAQPPTPPPPDASERIPAMRALMERADVAAAQQHVASERERILFEWRAITEIPAPSGHEEERAKYVEQQLIGSGLEVSRDAAGNVIAVRRGTGGGKHVVFDAHLDTVFALGTNVTTRLENGMLHAPGVGDNTRNVVALLAMIRAMNAANVQTRGDVTFVFTTEEETTFKGVKQFLADRGSTIHHFVALDGGYGGFTYGGIGIYWDRYHFIGPGGHTRSRNPPYSATLPLARALQRLYGLQIPGGAWLNVGMLGGADVFNAKAADAWMSVDVRSNDADTLHRLDAEIERIVREEATRDGMTYRREVVSKSEVAKLPGHRHSPMVLTTEAVYRAFGFDPEISDTASNHASVAILAGVPAISTGVAPCGKSHSVDELCEVEGIYRGIQRNIVLAVALAQGEE